MVVPKEQMSAGRKLIQCGVRNEAGGVAGIRQRPIEVVIRTDQQRGHAYSIECILAGRSLGLPIVEESGWWVPFGRDPLPTMVLD